MTRIARSRGSATPSINGATGPTLTVTGSTVLIKNRTNTANVPLTIQGMPSQGGNLTDWRNSAGSLLAAVHPNGEFKVPFVMDVGASGPYIKLDPNAISLVNRTTASNVAFILRGMAAQTGDLVQNQDSSATKLSGFTANGRLSYSAGITASTVGAAGGASALPATPSGYLLIDIGGTQYKVPYYPN